MMKMSKWYRLIAELQRNRRKYYRGSNTEEEEKPKSRRKKANSEVSQQL